MTLPTGTSTRPYLIRALHDWCTDNGFTPYLAVHVDATVQVPLEHVKNNEIVLNVGFEATSGLKLGNDFVEFRARFGGQARDICIPVGHVIAIYARENGQGMAFPAPEPGAQESQPEDAGLVARPGRLSAVGPAPADPKAPTEPRLQAVDLDSQPSPSDPHNQPPSGPGGKPPPKPSLKRVK
jgi:stringent starvation protein B